MAEPRSFDELMAVARGFQESRALLTALELDVFTSVGDGATAEDVATLIHADPRATGMLLNALVALGALTKTDDLFHSTPASRALGQARAGLMHTVNLWDTWSTLTEAVRTGTTVIRPGVEAHREEWTEAFIAAMHARARTEAGKVVALASTAGPCHMLDVGGGSGAFSIAFAQANPDLRAEVFDLGPVTVIAERNIREAGLAHRVSVRAGDLSKDDFGRDFDLVLLSAINHMLDDRENQALLAHCAQALRPGGRIVIREFILDPDRAGPRQAALFALNMLVGTRRGNAYTEGDYGEWLRASGFVDISRPDPSGDVIIGRRAG